MNYDEILKMIQEEINTEYAVYDKKSIKKDDQLGGETEDILNSIALEIQRRGGQ